MVQLEIFFGPSYFVMALAALMHQISIHTIIYDSIAIYFHINCALLRKEHRQIKGATFSFFIF